MSFELLVSVLFPLLGNMFGLKKEKYGVVGGGMIVCHFWKDVARSEFQRRF